MPGSGRAFRTARPRRSASTAGPIDDADGPEGQLNAWPMDESYVDYVEGNPCAGIINDPEAPITQEHLLALNEQGGEENVSIGYHAIEFLLWGQDLRRRRTRRPSGFGLHGSTAAGAVPAHRGHRSWWAICSPWLQEWAPGRNGNFRTTFLAQEPKEALRKIMVGIGTLSRSELAGERMAVALESPRSGRRTLLFQRQYPRRHHPQCPRDSERHRGPLRAQ